MGKSLNEIQKELEALEKQKRELEIEIEHVINTAIQRVANSQKLNRISEHIFTIRFSDMIGQPWEPRYYNWRESIAIVKRFLQLKPAVQWKGALQQKLNSTKPGRPVKFIFKRENAWYNRVTETIPVSYQFIQEIVNSLK